MFAGTAIATRVLLRISKPEEIVLIDNDPHKIARLREEINDAKVTILQADALQFSLVGDYDLAVADPYYEDVQLFLDMQLDNLRRSARTLVLVPGNIENHAWNESVRTRLMNASYRVISHELFGQIIFEATVR